MKFQYFNEFVNESESLKLKKSLREYSLVHLKDSMFELKGPNFFKQFTVAPYNSESISKLRELRTRLTTALDENDVNKIYAAINKAQRIDYAYGNIFSSEYSLVSNTDLSLSLDDDQKSQLADEKEFLLNVYSQLNKETREEILNSLETRGELLCCVIEALFYFIRKNDKENFYDGKTTIEISEEYDEMIEKVSKELNFISRGPFSNYEHEDEIEEDTRTAYWKCKMGDKKFIIKGTVLPAELYAEENVSKTKGLKLSLVKEWQDAPEGDYSFFDTIELERRIKKFVKK